MSVDPKPSDPPVPDAELGRRSTVALVEEALRMTSVLARPLPGDAAVAEDAAVRPWPGADDDADADADAAVTGPTVPWSPGDAGSDPLDATRARPTDAATTGGDRSAAPGDARAERYEIRGRLGEGGMGIVERVWDRDLMRELAVKRLRKEIGRHPELTRQFLREARVTAALEHPNIVPIHDLGITPAGEPFFTMKRVVGESLKEIIDALSLGPSKGGRWRSRERRLRLFLAVCLGVGSAHELGVLHRDLKPANVMVGPHGEALIMDWGLVAPIGNREGGDPLTELFSGLDPKKLGISGTPVYMSPEQARGEPLDARSDVWALGVILYELISLRIPYHATTTADLMELVRAGRIKPIREAVPEIDRSLASVVDKALSPDRDDRYGCVRDLARDVERVLDGLTPKAEHTCNVRRLQRWYFHRDPRFANLRVAEVDLYGIGSGLIGAAVGYAVSPWVGHWAWAVLVLVVGILACVPFLVRWLGSPKQVDDLDG